MCVHIYQSFFFRSSVYSCVYILFCSGSVNILVNYTVSNMSKVLWLSRYISDLCLSHLKFGVLLM